jgi:hypothetical protein
MVGASVLALSRVLTPELGIKRPALGTAIPFFLAFPRLLRVRLVASEVLLGEGRTLGVATGVRARRGAGGRARRSPAGLEPSTLPAVLGTAVGGVSAYWPAYYALVLTTNERALVRSLVGG